jgi:thiosulfate dehydrogenase
MARKKSSSGGFALGFVLGLVIAVAGAFAYYKFVVAPTRTPDKPLAFERPAASAPPPPVAHLPRAIRTAPFGTSEDVFEAGAHIYKLRCAGCHGGPNRDAIVAKSSRSAVRQLWKRQGNAVGVSAQETGVIYENISDGAPQRGMPAYEGQLSETQIWQLSLLLKSAGQQLPDPVLKILEDGR